MRVTVGPQDWQAHSLMGEAAHEQEVELELELARMAHLGR